MARKKMTMGLIVGNRGFFPDHLAKSGCEDMVRVLQAADIDVVALTPEQSKYGAVETREESRRCADLFRQGRDRIDWIVVTLPNFGEERASISSLPSLLDRAGPFQARHSSRPRQDRGEHLT
jgi:L-fucose isomerase-like protein